MVNGRTLEEEIKRIKEFFKNLSDDEFKQMIKECYPKTESNNAIED